MNQRIRWIVGPVLAAAVVGGAGVALAAGSSGTSRGPDYIYSDPNPFADARATVKVVAKGKNTSRVTLHVRNVDAPAGQTFGAHVHQFACGALATAAGPHYLHAGAIGTLEEREVWLDVTIDRHGRARTTATRTWSIDETSPRSVIIHAQPTNTADGTAGARLACIDLDGN